MLKDMLAMELDELDLTFSAEVVELAEELAGGCGAGCAGAVSCGGNS